MKLIGIATAFVLVACGGAPPKPSAASAPAAGPPASRPADCDALRGPLRRAQDATKLAQQSSEVAVGDALKTLQQVGTELTALQLQDPAVRALATDYAALVREQSALLSDMAPLMDRFGAAIKTANQNTAADRADLADCDGQKKPTKACEAKLKAATERATRDALATAKAEADVRAALKDPAMVERNRRINERDAQLVERLHATCGQLNPGPT